MKNQNYEIWLLIDSRSFGGIESHILLIAKQLLNHKISNRIIFLNDYGKHPLKKSLLEANIPFESLDGKLSSLFSVTKLRRPLLLHSHGYKANIFCKIIGKVLNISTLCTYHSGGSAPGRVKFYNLLDVHLSFLSKNIAVSHHMARQLPKSTKVIENFVDLPEQSHESQNTSKTIAFVGRLSPEKGADLFCKLSNFLPNIEYKIFGDGEMRQKLENLYGNKIKFLGVEKHMSKRWKDIGLLCMPSRHEGLPLAALEAMAHKVPVAAFAVGGLKKLISHNLNGYLAYPYDIKALASHIENYFKLPLFEKHRIAQSAQNTIQKSYSTNKAFPKLLNLYESITHQSLNQY